MSRTGKVPKYSNPWGLLRVGKGIEPMADLHGRPLQPRVYRRGGLRAVVALLSDATDIEPGQEIEPRPRDSAAWLRRRQSATFSRYRRDQRCTPIELRTIEALWFAGLALREVARREGVSPTAIAQRITGLQRKAPEFWNWWRLKNAAKRRRSA